MRLIFRCLIAFFPCLVAAQTDTVFWFAAPEVSIAGLNLDRPILLRISAGSQPAFVTVSQPANATFINQTVNIPANGTATVDLTSQITVIENLPPNTVLNYGILIKSSSFITVYYEVLSQQFLNPEIFSLKGSNALGTDFFIPSQNFWRNTNTYTPTPYSSFDMVATEDNTTVTITPSKNIVGHAGGITFSIILNKGQTYSATAASQLAAQHLDGSKVIADKPIAITVKDDLLEYAAYGSCRDLAGDQIVPTNVLGKKYVVVKGYFNYPDKAFIMAIQNNTDVFINGNPVPAATINAGQTFVQDVTTGAIYIESSEPVYVLHITGFGCEVSYSLLPSIECTGSHQVSFTRSTNRSFGLIVIVKSGGQNSFILNGSGLLLPGSAFSSVPGSGGQWYYASVTYNTTQVPVGTASVISNPVELFHVGIINGDNTGGCSYGYFSNFNALFASTLADTSICSGESIVLTASGGVDYRWSPGSFLSDSVIANPIATPDSTLTYTVIVSSGVCTDTADVTVTVNASTGSPISIDVQICAGDSFFIGNQWQHQAGIYLDTLTAQSGCDSIVSINLLVGSIITVHTATICTGDSFFAENVWQKTAGAYHDSLISISGCDSVIVTNLFVSDTIVINRNFYICEGDSIFLANSWQTNAGVYYDSMLSHAGCDSITITNLLINGNPFVTTIPDTTIEPGASVILSTVSDASLLVWSPDSSLSCVHCTSPVVSPDHSITYVVQATDSNGCKTEDFVTIQIIDSDCKIAMPTGFSPNQDGINDEIGPFINGDIQIEEFKIFNRWGQMVFEAFNTNRWWDGRYKNEAQPLSVYTYYLKYTCQREAHIRSGNITLIR